jgi:hypothetical protein
MNLILKIEIPMKTRIWRDITRMVRIIHTFNPEQEIWHHIEKLTNRGYISKLLNYRINKEFFSSDTGSEFRIDIKKINDAKKNHSVEVYKPISLEKTNKLSNNITEIVIDARQAIEIYKASQNVTIIAKPILLYYSFVMLARVLFLSTYEKNYDKKHRSDAHGLDFVHPAQVKCMQVGAFPRFHDSFSSSPEIYLGENVFAWEDLIALPTNRFEMAYDFKEHKIKRNIQFSIHGFPVDELTREILFAYSMIILAGYHPDYWTAIINKKEYGWKIVDYVRTTQSLFPNMIFNYLHGEYYEFYPEARLVGDEEHYRPQF